MSKRANQPKQKSTRTQHVDTFKLFDEDTDAEYNALINDARRHKELAARQRVFERRLCLYFRHNQIAEIMFILQRRPYYVRRFGPIFDAMQFVSSRQTHLQASIVPIMKQIVAMPSFRTAAARSALSPAFVALCLRFDRELQHELMNTIVYRKPRDSRIAELFNYCSLSVSMLDAVRRWTYETSYVLRFSSHCAPEPRERVEYAHLFTLLHRQNRLERSALAYSPNFFTGIASLLDDHTFFELFDVFCRSYSIYVHMRFEPRRELSARYRRVALHEQLLALAPLLLPVYLVVDIVNLQLPLTEHLTPQEYRQLVTMASRIAKAQRAVLGRRENDQKSRALENH